MGWWPAVLFVLIMQVLTPLLAVSALAAPLASGWANPLTNVPICAARRPQESPSAPLSHHNGVCPACAFCAAVQPALTPAPVAAPLPLIRPGSTLVPSVSVAWHASPPVQANARSPPEPALQD